MLKQNNRLEIFKAQTQNVRSLECAWKQVNKTINAAYADSNSPLARTNEKILALIYCAYAEAVFSKVIHTPNGLTLNEISQITYITKGKKKGKNKNQSKRSIVEAWKKCVELSLKKVEGKNSGHIANTRQNINNLIDQYIKDPSLLRNKIAHGQWEIALNTDNTNTNRELTEELESISIVELYRRKSAFQSLSHVVEDIIESPNKAHHRDYWFHINEFKQEQLRMSSWTLERKIEQLRIKKRHKKQD